MIEQFFFQIMSDYLNGRKTKPVTEVDWELLLRLARIHQIEAILYSQCKEMIPVSLAEPLKRAYHFTLASYMKRQAEMAKISSLLEAHHISFFVLKGAIVKDYYPQPALRTMGDVDIVVHPEDREAVHELLLQNGFMNVNHHRDQSWHYAKNNLNYELHDRLMYDEDINATELKDFFNDCWRFGCNGKLDASFHFLFLLAHLRSHLMKCGIGLRQFMDLTVMAQKEKSLDWPWIEERLNSLGLLQFAQTCFAFIYRWVDVDLPLKSVKLDDSFFAKATESILNGGVFGTNTEGSFENIAINAARGSGAPQILMMKRAVQTVFPSYKTLSGNDHYRFLDGKPLLLPAAWGYRLYRGGCTLTKNRRAGRMLWASRKAVKERDQYLKNWGL